MCVCNDGTSGNPYESCRELQKNVCNPKSCGANAECRQNYNKIECVCSSGFTGNPYIGCEDINECNNNVCGQSSVCLNTIGSYDCRCKEGYAGNPFIMCSEVQVGVCKDVNNCDCNENVLCPNGFSCNQGQCKNICETVHCGPKAGCVNGACICPPGYIGNPNDLIAGCKIQGQCHSDLDCYDTEICFQLGKGSRKCLDACSKAHCGPNALCVVENHRSSCICASGYFGNPGDLNIGCQLEERTNQKQCRSDRDCHDGNICAINVDGLQKCISPCETVACGLNEVCQLDAAKHATCACKPEYVWNPVKSICEKPSVPDCNSDVDCEPVSSCQPDEIGILKCTPVCSHFTCPSNAACIAESHRGQCHCLTGFTGNPNDRTGCKPIDQNQCNSDNQCPEQEVCTKHEKHNLLTCRPACDFTNCGPNAVCIVNNHVAKCQCPPGSYVGNPNNATGCRSVPCVYNLDCPPSQLCNRLTHTCFDVCDEDSCGDNAVCIAEGGKATCQCPPGYKPNPVAEIECTPLDTCNPNPCHSTAICESSSFGFQCKCPPGTVGDPLISGCRPEGICPNGDRDCPNQSVCHLGRCVNPCETIICPSNSQCEVKDRKPVCTCINSFVSSPNGDCVRQISTCYTDTDCGNGVCLNEQCRSVCRNDKNCLPGEKCVQNKCMSPCNSHNQCAENNACINNMCVLGCRSNKNCPDTQSCINNKCLNPCELEGTCGPNAICSCQNHQTICKCPEGFMGNPTPQQGCIRQSLICENNNNCPKGFLCFNGQCQISCNDNSVCAIGERCTNNSCVKVCYGDNNCIPGEICRNGLCLGGCSVDADCRTSEICLKGQCKCAKGFIGTPNGCLDINECEANPCHPSAKCQNKEGSYLCLCPEGSVGDPYIAPGCLSPNYCRRNTECDNTLICNQNKCQDPCKEEKCGPNAICKVTNHKLKCSCPAGHLGDPFDKAYGCFKVECLVDNDCVNTRFCETQSNKCLSKLLIREVC